MIPGGIPPSATLHLHKFRSRKTKKRKPLSGFCDFFFFHFLFFYPNFVCFQHSTEFDTCYVIHFVEMSVSSTGNTAICKYLYKYIHIYKYLMNIEYKYDIV